MADSMFKVLKAFREAKGMLPASEQGEWNHALQHVKNTLKSYDKGKDPAGRATIGALLTLLTRTADVALRNGGQQDPKTAKERKMDLATAQLLLQFLPMLDSAHKLQSDALKGFHQTVETYIDCLRSARPADKNGF